MESSTNTALSHHTLSHSILSNPIPPIPPIPFHPVMAHPVLSSPTSIAYPFRLILGVPGSSVFHENPSQSYDLSQENGVGVQVGAKAVEHLKDRGAEVRE